MREADVRDQPAAEERRDAAARAIEELIGNDEVERLVLLLQAADRARREDVLDAERLEAEDVGAEVQLRRHQPMPDAVPREKGDALAAQRADDVRRGRLAERRRDRRSSRSVSSAMSYRPLPPMMPIVIVIDVNQDRAATCRKFRHARCRLRPLTSASVPRARRARSPDG